MHNCFIAMRKTSPISKGKKKRKEENEKNKIVAITKIRKENSSIAME